MKSSLDYLKNKKYPLVVKADGLAAGKGVYICNSFFEAEKAVEEIFGGKFGEANEILFEEFLSGEEMSFLSYTIINRLKFLIQLKIIKEYLRVIKEKILEEWELIHLQDLIIKNLKIK